ncbi:MAG: hypothetical protein JST55_10060 [Bacteroidetes bacterium]|nr:hypothetical protein [Bacteroidota bacterium]
MKNTFYNLKFVLAIVVSFTLLTACSKVKEMADKEKEKTDKKEETTKKETTKEETKKESTTEKEETAGSKLYFCEDYKNGKEIGVSDRFTTGWLTVMVRTDKPLGVGKVELRMTKIKDADGDKISEKIIDTVPFDVQANWDYTYFQDKKRLKFTSPGTYKVTMQKIDGTPICSGEVEVTK